MKKLKTPQVHNLFAEGTKGEYVGVEKKNLVSLH